MLTRKWQPLRSSLKSLYLVEGSLARLFSTQAHIDKVPPTELKSTHLHYNANCHIDYQWPSRNTLSSQDKVNLNLDTSYRSHSFIPKQNTLKQICHELLDCLQLLFCLKQTIWLVCCVSSNTMGKRLKAILSLSVEIKAEIMTIYTHSLTHSELKKVVAAYINTHTISQTAPHPSPHHLKTNYPAKHYFNLAKKEDFIL